MLTDAQADLSVPDQWLAVLDAVADACATENADSAPTDLVLGRIPDADGSWTVRTLLRLLLRRGYVRIRPGPGNGPPVRWSLTPSGQSLRTHR